MSSSRFSFVHLFLLLILFQCSDKLGLSLELGSFAAGVMISTTDLAEHTLEQVSLDHDVLPQKTGFICNISC